MREKLEEIGAFEDTSSSEKLVALTLKQKGPMERPDIPDEVGLTSGSVRRVTRNLQEKGIIEMKPYKPEGTGMVGKVAYIPEGD